MTKLNSVEKARILEQLTDWLDNSGVYWFRVDDVGNVTRQGFSVTTDRQIRLTIEHKETILL